MHTGEMESMTLAVIILVIILLRLPFLLAMMTIRYMIGRMKVVFVTKA